MFAFLRLVPISAWAIVALGLALGVQQIRLSMAKSEISDLRAAIAESVLEGERVTRQAVENARLRERADRDRLIAEAEAAASASRLEAIAARKRSTDLSRRIQELSDADPSVDAWRVAPVPGPIRVLLAPSDNEAG